MNRPLFEIVLQQSCCFSRVSAFCTLSTANPRLHETLGRFTQAGPLPRLLEQKIPRFLLSCFGSWFQAGSWRKSTVPQYSTKQCVAAKLRLDALRSMGKCVPGRLFPIGLLVHFPLSQFDVSRYFFCGAGGRHPRVDHCISGGRDRGAAGLCRSFV